MLKALLFLAAVIALGIKAATATTVASTCLASDMHALRLRSFVRDLVTTTDSTHIALRNSLGLKAMDSTRVTLVSDNRICDKAATGINTALATPGLVRSLYVVAAGTMYAAQDPGHPAGEWWPTHTLDNKYKLIGVVLAP
jgi:hypothetical protein